MPAARPTCPLAGAALALCMTLWWCNAASAQSEPAVPRHAEPPHARPEKHLHIHPRMAVTASAAKSHLAHPARHPPTPPPPPVPTPVAPVVPVLPPALPKGTNTGLPLPRFASLRAEVVNLRGGPGTRYPIQWVYKRRDLPVEIEREFDIWRLVRDSDGVKGWVHQATLVGSRSFIILGASDDATAASTDAPAPAAAAAPNAPVAAMTSPVTFVPSLSDAPPGSQILRTAPQSDAPAVAILKPGVVGRIRLCAAGSDWCRVSVKDYSGWLPRQAFWGLLPDETIQPP